MLRVKRSYGDVDGQEELVVCTKRSKAEEEKGVFRFRRAAAHEVPRLLEDHKRDIKDVAIPTTIDRVAKQMEFIDLKRRERIAKKRDDTVDEAYDYYILNRDVPQGGVNTAEMLYLDESGNLFLEDECFSESLSEDSNQEDFYRNDYPDEESDRSGDSYGDDYDRYFTEADHRHSFVDSFLP